MSMSPSSCGLVELSRVRRSTDHEIDTNGCRSRLDEGLVGADDLEALVDEDVVRPVDADVVDLVLAVTDLHDTVDDAARVSGQGGFRRLVRGRSAHDRPRPLAVVRRDLTDLLRRGRCTALEGDHPCRRGSRRSTAVSRLHDDLCGPDRRATGRPEYEDAFALGDGTRRGRTRPLLVFRGGRLVDGHLLTR